MLLARLDGLLEATHARPRLILARHPSEPAFDAFWIAGGRLVDWGPLTSDLDELEQRTQLALIRAGRTELAAHVPPNEIDELRILGTWLASHPDVPQLDLDPAPDRGTLRRFASAERQLDDRRADLILANGHGRADRRLAPDQRQRDRAEAW